MTGGSYQLPGQVQIRRLSGWGRVCTSVSEIVTPPSLEALREVMCSCRRRGSTIIPRGSGFSYGDPALNRDNVVLATHRLDRILKWDADLGVLDVEPGVTMGEICNLVASSGWWPPVVPGTKGPTAGGCVAANVHGKNNWRMGALGEHIDELDILAADGRLTTITPNDARYFEATVGGMGLLGVVTRLRLRMRRHSQLVHTQRWAAGTLAGVMSILSRWEDSADAMVGWVDGFAGGDELGRGLVQVATELETCEGQGAEDRRRLGPEVLPASVGSGSWLALKPFANSLGMRAVNAAQYELGSLRSGAAAVVQPAQFEFFHDAAPSWNKAFPGLVQYQMFIPEVRALNVFDITLRRAQEHSFFPILVVLKRHRSDGFLLSPNLDGYSMSMDFAISAPRYEALASLLSSITEDVVLPAGGRFYLAKDSTSTGSQLRRAFSDAAVDQLLHLKDELDPDGLFQSDMYRRLFLY